MELELCIEPDDAARLARLKLFGSADRARPQALRIVWHDSPDAALTAAGLALAQERNAWRLERLVPAESEFWSPGGPVPVLAQAASLAELGHALPESLAPVAAFAGRRVVHGVTLEHGSVTLTLLRGVLRAVTAESHVSRLYLSGDDPAVRAASLALAEALPVEIPRATLAGEALAEARGLLPLPRRLGAPTPPDEAAMAEAFRFALGHLTDVMLHFAPAAAAGDEGPEPVHQMRVALRRLRSVVTVFRPVLDCAELEAARQRLKALSARLGPTRDWDVFLGETLPSVRAAFPHEQRLARLAAAAERRQRECHAALRAFIQGPEFRRLAIELAWLAGAQSWHPALAEEADTPLRDFAVEVMRHRLHKLPADADLTEADAPSLHQMRLHAKRLRYAAEIFAPLYPGKTTRRFIHRLAAVQERLGWLNDRATAETLLADLGGASGRHAHAVGLVLGFTAAGNVELRPRAERSWEKFHHTAEFWE